MNCRLSRVLLLLSFVVNVGLAGVLVHQLNETVPVDEPVEAQATTSAAALSNGSYPLIRILDGDTLSVLMNSKEERVRLIGINAPEPNDPGGPECHAQEALTHLRELAKTGVVTLTFDDSQGERDRYDRLLAYVALPDGTDLGEAMLRNGYAVHYTFDQPFARTEAYKAAEAEAIQNLSGLWADDACVPTSEE